MHDLSKLEKPAWFQILLGTTRRWDRIYTVGRDKGTRDNFEQLCCSL